MKIPILKPIKFDYLSVFTNDTELNDMDEFFEQISNMYPHTLLDIFDRQLENDAEELKYLDSEYFRLSNENKYLDFITDVFLHNKECCYINIDFSVLRYDGIINQLNKLDVIDKYLILNQEFFLRGNKNKTFLIDDIFLLKMFVKGILREILQVDLYFAHKPLLLFHNYDLSIPLVFKTKEDKLFYEQLANNYELYFR